MEKKNHALKYGLLGGLLLVVFSLLLDLTGLTDPAAQKGSWIASVVSLAIFFWALYSAIRSEREDLGGGITFGQGFKVGLLAALIIALISGVYMYVYMAFINPDMVDQIREMTMEKLAAQGLSDEQIESQMQIMGKMMSPGMMTIWGFIGNFILGAIVAVVASAILKKDPSNSLDAA